MPWLYHLAGRTLLVAEPGMVVGSRVFRSLGIFLLLLFCTEIKYVYLYVTTNILNCF